MKGVRNVVSVVIVVLIALIGHVQAGPGTGLGGGL